MLIINFNGMIIEIFGMLFFTILAVIFYNMKLESKSFWTIWSSVMVLMLLLAHLFSIGILSWGV